MRCFSEGVINLNHKYMYMQGSESHEDKEMHVMSDKNKKETV